MPWWISWCIAWRESRLLPLSALSNWLDAVSESFPSLAPAGLLASLVGALDGLIQLQAPETKKHLSSKCLSGIVRIKVASCLVWHTSELSPGMSLWCRCDVVVSWSYESYSSVSTLCPASGRFLCAIGTATPALLHTTVQETPRGGEGLWEIWEMWILAAKVGPLGWEWLGPKRRVEAVGKKFGLRGSKGRCSSGFGLMWV